MDSWKPVEHGFKAFFFRVTRSLLKRKQREFQAIDGSAISKVLFLRPEKIGDMVISFPVFDGLRRRYPHLEIGILGSPRNEAIIRDDPRFSKVFMYRKNLWKDIAEVLSIRREKYDCVVDMICDDSVTALYLSQLCAPEKPRIGVGKVKFREFYDFNYDHRMGNTGHIIENTLKLLEAFGIDTSTVSCYAGPRISRTDSDRAQAFLDQLAADGASPLRIGYNLSAGSLTRLWSLDNAESLLRRITARYPGSQVIVICVPDDRKRAEELASRVGQSIHLLPPGLSLLAVCALIERLDLLVSPDTSLVHIARSFHVPVVGLYSRFMKNFLLWRPFGQEMGAVVSGNDDNIHDITVDQVYDALVNVLASSSLVSR